MAPIRINKVAESPDLSVLDPNAELVLLLDARGGYAGQSRHEPLFHWHPCATRA